MQVDAIPSFPTSTLSLRELSHPSDVPSPSFFLLLPVRCVGNFFSVYRSSSAALFFPCRPFPDNSRCFFRLCF